MEGNTRENLTFTQNVKKHGYETTAPLSFSGNFLAANALDANGNVLATSDVWDKALGAVVSKMFLFIVIETLFIGQRYSQILRHSTKLELWAIASLAVVISTTLITCSCFSQPSPEFSLW